MHGIIRIRYMQGLDSIFYVVVLVMSIVVHEVAHGYAAELEGDPTARYAGRLTLNPIPHIDPIGSVVVPLILLVTGSPLLIGWAKPVPYSERNFRDKKRGTIAVASAGILANLLIAVVFGLALRFSGATGAAAHALGVLVRVNLVLAFFNLIPIPPLDGSKILFNVLPARSHQFQKKVEQLALPLLLVFIVFVWPYVFPLVTHAFTLLTGSYFTV